MALPQILEWFTLTEMVNEFKTPASFLRNLVFRNERILSTENVVYRVQTKARKVAPFVERGSEALLSGGYSAKEVNFSCPNIRIRRPLDAWQLLFTRDAGSNIFVGAADQQEAAQREVALQLQALNDEVTNAEEYLCSQAIQGVITYNVSDEAAYTVNMNKPVGNTITLTTFWDQAGSTPVQDIMLAKRTMHDEVSLNPMVCVLGNEATDVFLAQAEFRELLKNNSPEGATVVGRLLLDQDIGESGAMYLGRMFGIEFWSYHRQLEVAGSSVDLIRPKYAEFLNVSPAAQHVMYYGGIADLDANESGLIATRRFSKSWRQPDPSVQQILIHSRPLPIMRRPGSVVSMKVVSG